MPTDFMKHPDETIIWEGKPEFKPFLLKGLLYFGQTLLSLVVFWLFIITSNIGRTDPEWSGMYIFAIIIGGPGIFQLCRKGLSYRRTYYYLTNKMIYIFSGAIDRKLTVLDRKKILLVDIEKSKIEKKFNTATITLYFGETKKTEDGEEKVFQKFESIKNPERIIRLLP
jgi:uncharacterized membrane protein YdbT with pleckstrin-like domain